jgi:hypothetical protein
MPLYVFEDTETGNTFEDIMSYDKSVEYLNENPHMRRVPAAPRISTSVGDRVKIDGGMQEVLQRAAAQNPQSPLAERHGSKSIKDVKTREVVRKHFGSKPE